MLDEQTLTKMRLGICLVCNIKIKKHSKHKLIVCKSMFKKRFNIAPATMTEYDEKGRPIRTINIDEAISFTKKAVED